MEVVFLLVFIEWYASRYFRWNIEIDYRLMVALILGLWGIILGVGLWRDKRRNAVPRVEDLAALGGSSVDKRSTSQSDSVDKSRA